MPSQSPPNFDVAIIGAAGFIATPLIERLRADGLTVFGFAHQKPEAGILFAPIDLTVPSSLKPQDIQVKTLIYASAIKGRFKQNSLEWGNQGKVCAPDFTKLLSKLGITTERMITIGSSEEYGARTTPELITEDDAPAPLSSYGYWKTELQARAAEWAAQNNKPTIHLRPFVVYGPGQDKQMFLYQLISALSAGEEFPMTKGEQWRSFCSLRTVVGTIAKLVKAPQWPTACLNVSNSNYIQIAELAKRVQRLIGKGSLKLGAIPYREEEVWHQQPDLSRLKQLAPELVEENFDLRLRELID